MKNKIKAIMLKNGYKGTIRELAKILEISEPSVVNKLEGKEAFKLKEIRLFAKKFKLSEKEIYDIFIKEE